MAITAGFYNGHVHFTRQRWANAGAIPAAELEASLKDMLTSHGFTSVFDLGSPLQNTLTIRRRIESGEVSGPRLRTTGDMLLGKGFTPPDTMLKTLGLLRAEVEPELSRAEEAGARATKRLDAGADGLKLYAASAFAPFGTLPDQVMQAVVSEAHLRRKLVFAHPQSRDGLLAAIRNGVDILAHTTPPSGEWDKTVLDELSRKRPALIPTLKVWTVLLEAKPEQSDQWTRNNLSQLFAWLELGGEIIFGTDIDAGMADFDPTVEYLLMMQAGMTFRQILGSLTTIPAKKFGDTPRLGRIEKGLLADITVVRGDPSRHISALADVSYTIIDGKLVYTATQTR
jgi:imidazolonepropionase-like amidohydrolase